MNQIELIKARHSVRSYLDKPIEAEKAEKLKAKIAECNAAGGLRLQFCPDAGKTFNRVLNKFMGLGSAPSVIACIGRDGDDLEERIGYYGERLVRFAQGLGLNTCWAGTFNPKNVPAEIGEGERLVIVIAIGYGANQGKQHRSKDPEKVITSGGEKPYWFNYGVEMALLAPTAINQQKFLIDLKEDGSVTFADQGGIFSKVDLGIVRYHFEVGAEFAKSKDASPQDASPQDASPQDAFSRKETY